MIGLPTASPRAAFIATRRIVLAALLVGVVAACSGTAGAPSQSVAGSTATTPAAATPTAPPAATPTAFQTMSPAATSAIPTPTAGPTAKPTPNVTPLPVLAQGLCRGSQLSLTITSWQFDGTSAYAHVTATNKSSASCDMRGFSEARIADAHGKIIGDAGSDAASVRNTDPLYTLNHGDGINTIVTWTNWCKSAPAQKVFVAMVEPFGLGSMIAKANGDAPIPICLASNQRTSVSSEAWLP